MANERDEIVIEIAGPTNDHVMFEPLQEVLRGRYERGNLHPGATATQSGVLSITNIPGLRLALDVAGRKARMFDPLEGPGNSDLLNKLSALLAGFNQKVVPVNERVIADMNDEQVASWWWHMRNLVEKKLAVVVSGNFGSKPKGRIRVDYLTNYQGQPKYMDEYEMLWAGNWPPPKRIVMAGKEVSVEQ